MFKFLSRVISCRISRGAVVVLLPYMTSHELLSLLCNVRRKHIHTRLLDGTFEVVFPIRDFIYAVFEDASLSKTTK